MASAFSHLTQPFFEGLSILTRPQPPTGSRECRFHQVDEARTIEERAINLNQRILLGIKIEFMPCNVVVQYLVRLHLQD